MLESQVTAREIRNRLWNPPSGRVSSELEVISAAEQRRREVARQAQEAIEVRRLRRELLVALISAHERSGFRSEPDRQKPKPVGFEQIAKATCEHFKQPKLLVFSNRRKAELVKTRHVIMYLCTEFTAMSFPRIGRLLGGRDHTTVLHGHRKVAWALTDGNEELIADVATIKGVLGLP